MASIGHVLVGLAAARAYTAPAGAAAHVSRGRAAIAFSALSLAPDIDVLAFRFGIPYHAPWGHRGATHSLAVAALVGLLCAAAARRDRLPAWRTGVFAALVAASHGLLDALTDGGLGPALFWPFSDLRFFAPWTPLPVAPIGAGMLSPRGAYVLGVELAVFAPLLIYGAWPRRTPQLPPRA